VYIVTKRITLELNDIKGIQLVYSCGGEKKRVYNIESNQLEHQATSFDGSTKSKRISSADRIHFYYFLNSTINLAPLPNSLSYQTFPFIASTYFLTIERPRPVELSPSVGRACNF
jgi:hypothetical protein